MGRFSCFYGQIHSHKHKKPVQPSFEEMVKMLQLGSENHDVSAKSINPAALQKLPMVEDNSDNLSNGTEHVVLSRGCKSGELKCEHHAEDSTSSVNLRRSFSVGCELDQKRSPYGYDDTDGCLNQEYFCDGSYGCQETAIDGQKSPCTTQYEQDEESHIPVSPHLSSDVINNYSSYSAGDSHYIYKEDHEDSTVPLHTEYADHSGGRTTPTPSTILKSYSMPNIRSGSPTSPEFSLHNRNRSFEDLNVLPVKQEDILAPDISASTITVPNKDDKCCMFEKFEEENAVLDNYDPYNYACSSKDWIVPVNDEMSMMKNDQAESSSCHWEHLPNVDLKFKRIEDWVVDLQHCSPMEQTEEEADLYAEVKGNSALLHGPDAIKAETKINPGVEAAKKYISSLNATATTAHLANHGLVVVPLLSAFISLKVLNLSGNSIVRITSGALPRGLHMLNLSKNKISTIEGLRELTRLRVLDLSYNKVSRIGHGLASCSSLKELYLAGNKISEVEGLHRLLKLSVLDLRFNKIATSKCLGQLAANYNSLQAISLEGNPAQKNVGDEQLKKCLLGLLPHLTYYNRQHIKTSTLKDSLDRSVRLGISDRALRSDLGLRSDHKSSSRRGGNGGSVLKRSSHSSIHGHKGFATESLKQYKGKPGLAPAPSGTRTSHHHHYFDLDNKLRSLKAGLSLHKSRSEGTLAGL